MNSDLPTGIVTFLFTDIEGSTQLWEQSPLAMQSALARHDFLLRNNIETQGGHIIKTTGDGFHAAFDHATQGLTATLACQQALARETWDGLPHSLHVRMGLHTGESELRDGDYFGSASNRAARLMSIAAGGQTLLSSATVELVRDALPLGVSLQDLGEHCLKDLSRPERVYQLNAPGLQTDFPPLRSLNTLPNNLPIQLTTFIGREKEIADIIDLLNSARLVTLTGSGGTGKTRLALEVGAQELTHFPHGVWLIELASHTDPDQIIPAIAQVFGLHEHTFATLTSLVIDYLRYKKTLLILDNCEHLVKACAQLANDLLHQCAGLKFLTSTREALGIAGEIAYRIPSLADSEATQLFIERARSVNSKFKSTESDTSSIAQICHRLDGIPLAIELAAARVKLLSPEQIASRLDDRFRLLVGGSRTALPRQQTLRAMIDWSYDLLSEEEKRLLQFASVFMGGWTLDALEAVAGDPKTMEQLVNKSLVVTEERENEMRYFMLETIRQYAREKLLDANESSTARDRHFIYFDELSEIMWEEFRSADVLPIRDRADDEVENFRAAIEWGLGSHVDEAVRLAANYCVISSWVGLPEGLTWAKTAVERVKSLPPAEGDANLSRQKLIARAMLAQGMVGLGQGKLPLVLQDLSEAISISRLTGDKRILGYSLGLYLTALNYINAPGEEGVIQEALEIFTHEINDNFGLGMAYLNMARVAARKGDENEKEKYYKKLKEMTSTMPMSFQVGIFFLGMGMDENTRGNYETARQFIEYGLIVFTRIRNRIFQTVLRSELGHIARHTGDILQARQIYQETIKGFQDLGNRAAISHQLECFGFLAITEDNPHRAARLFGAAEALREKIGSPRTDHERIEYDQSIARLHEMLEVNEFKYLRNDGRSLTMEQAIRLALCEEE